MTKKELKVLEELGDTPSFVGIAAYKMDLWSPLPEISASIIFEDENGEFNFATPDELEKFVEYYYTLGGVSEQRGEITHFTYLARERVNLIDL